MTEETLARGQALLREIAEREVILTDLGNKSAEVSYFSRGSHSTFTRYGKNLLDPAIQRACLAMIQGSIADDTERLKAELRAL